MTSPLPMRPACGLVLITTLFLGLNSCALAPLEYEHPPIFSLQGEIEPNEDEPLGSDYGYVVLSWYLFTTNGLTDSHWTSAAQIDFDIDEPSFELELTEQPPDEAFLETGDNSALTLPTTGRLAIGFLTVYEPQSEDEEFDWDQLEDHDTTCPDERTLVLWWDGAPIDADDIGFSEGRLERGLNLLNVGDAEGDSSEYSIISADTPLQLMTCPDGRAEPLRSCGLTGPQSIWTIMPGDEGYPEEAPPEDEYECYGCGTFYEMPNACEIELSVLCRNCLSITVHVDPDDVPDSWPCTAPGNEECDSDEEPQCLLGTRYECIDNTWKMAAECDDQCCEEGCTSISEDHDDEGPESSEEEED